MGSMSRFSAIDRVVNMFESEILNCFRHIVGF